MSVSYGMITITDTTDLGQLSVYLTGSTVRQQIYDSNTNPVAYYPDWVNSPLIITPHVYFNGQSQNLNSNKIEVSWSKVEGGVTYPNGTVTVFPTSPTTTTCPESVVDSTSGYKKLQRPANLSINSTGATYTATITYYPIDGDRTITLQAIATLDLTISNNGIDGQNGSQGEPGTPAKTLQLIGSGSHFTYTWEGNATGTTTINLTVEKSSTVDGVHWYCDNTLIQSGGSPYTQLTLAITTANISTYSTNFHTNKVAQFKIIETDALGNEINNGLIDYFAIYKLQDAQPGSSTYSAYLDNDEEVVNEYNGVIDFTNATSTFHLDKGGQNDLKANSGWTVSISDSGNITYIHTQSAWNTLPSGNDNQITSISAMTGNSAWIQFTAQNTDTSVSDQIKRFTIVKNPSLVSHSLRLDSVVANRDTTAAPNGNYTPAQIVIDAITRTGGGTSAYHTANVIEAVIYYKDGSNSSTLHNAEGSALTIVLADKTASGNNSASAIDYITTVLKYNNETVDSQKIVISSDGINGINGEDGEDGQDGDSPWTFISSNQFDAISTDFSYNISTNYTIKLPIEAAQGITSKIIYYGGQTYPTVIAQTPIFTTITPKYYLGDTEVTTAGNAVDNIRYIIPANTNIGANGSITLTLTYAAGQSISQTYTFKAQPEALKPIRMILTPDPSDTFENQSGSITITPTILSGVTPISSEYWSSKRWEAYMESSNNQMAWIEITSISSIDDIYLSGNNIIVKGSAVEGYLGLRFSASVSRGGISESYTEYINLKDIDDPLQVTLHSTVGEQIINSQGIGIIYARVIRRGDQEDYDNIVPDNMLAIGTIAPTSSTASGKTGYFRYITTGNDAGKVEYYWRTQGSGAWSGPRGNASNPYKYTYTWSFRDSNNTSYVFNGSGNPPAINYALNSNNNTQFIYVDSSVINNKITAVVKVEL